ncbi:MAG: exodeoxyribonuclease VII small subunit [Clostridiales bacterium]|jgi:exodeoxyribonuclease VII small subunit|nr:exodeoxyribonuclease VII small subunit [Clostridiales bacterium]
MNEELTFEKSMARLEEIVKLLERGDAPLDTSLKLFEEGTMLIRCCGEYLDRAEQKVVRLMKSENGEPVELPFESEDN